MKHAYKIRFAIAGIIFTLIILGICGVFYPLKIYDLKFAPLLQRIFIVSSVIAAVLTGGIALLTQLFGRFYCSTICSWGFLQEIAAFYTLDKDFIIEKSDTVQAKGLAKIRF